MAEGISSYSEQNDTDEARDADSLQAEVVVGADDPGAEEITIELTAMGDEFRRLLDPERIVQTPTADVILSPIECQLLQKEETEALDAIFGDEFQPLNEGRSWFLIHICSQSGDIKDEDAINVWFCLPPNYPCIPPVFEIETNQSQSLSYSDADKLYDLLMMEATDGLGRGVIFSLVSTARDFVAELLERKLREQEQELSKQKDAEPTKAEGEDHSPVHHGNQFYNDMVYKPSHFIGSVHNLLEKIPPDLQVTHIENILRQDLANRFKHTLDAISHMMWKKKRASPYLYHLEPQIAFHGTRMDFLPSIVQKGLIVPGRNGVEVVHGSNYGVGIYLSPDPSFSLNYSDGRQLIVCACVLGFSFYPHKSSHTPKGADSRYFTVISPCGKEMVFFNASQVLPCYIIKLQSSESTGVDHGKQSHHQLPPLLQRYQEEARTESDDAKRKQEKLLARANKFLPYGFGPGSRTIIEDAGNIDDDEEDYGDYQLLRYPDANSETVHSDIIKTHTLQEYRYKSK